MQNAFDIEIERLVGKDGLNQEILLGVSGGVDSMCMATLFLESPLGLKFSVAHVNFSLRENDCDRDEAHVRKWCETHGIRIFTKKVDTHSYAEEHNLSTQMAAREIRYDWFQELMNEHGIRHLAIAHNLNDSVETFFLNLLRGTGLNGLSGIKKKNGAVIRPLMGFTRAQISAFAEEHNVEFCEDMTNHESHYSRNRIRNEVFPEFAVINPSFLMTVNREMERFAEIGEIMDEFYDLRKFRILHEEDGVTHVDIKALKKEGHIEYWLFRILDPFGFNDSQLAQIADALDSQSGKTFYSSTHKVVRDREVLKIYPLSDSDALAEVRFATFKKGTDFDPMRNHPDVLYVDARKAGYPLNCRRWQVADRFRPFGMRGFKKLSDFFTDLKLDIEEKRREVVVYNVDKHGNEQIVCIAGRRIDDRFKVTSKTKKVLAIRKLK